VGGAPLRQVVSEHRKVSLLSVAEEKENSPCRQGEEVDNHPIQRRKGKCPEKEVGKYRIQTWRENAKSSCQNGGHGDITKAKR
jgi:hypothetical protein